MTNNQSFKTKSGKLFDKRKSQIGILLFVSIFTIVAFQNCGQSGDISLIASESALNSVEPSPNQATGQDAPQSEIPPLSVCQGISCTLDPITKKVAVTTILLALGDESNNQLVINGGSSQLIAETVIRYTSPVKDPRILIVQARDTNGESNEDTIYVRNVLLSRYRSESLLEPERGLSPKDFEGYDVVWFNNPGHPMSLVESKEALIQFKGGVVLQGDDLSWGTDFSMEDLTHLKYVDNGSSVKCDGIEYRHDNNNDNQYRVFLDSKKIPSASSLDTQFFYGNDIDNTVVVGADIEVLASALGGPSSCTSTRPVIVRYYK